MTKRVIFIQYTNPAIYPPLQHCSRILANAGWDVLFLGSGAFGADCLSFPYHERIRVKKLQFCGPGWKQKLHYCWFVLWVMLWTLCFGRSWIYASNHLAAPAALIVGYLCGVHIIYHEHDPPMMGDGNERRIITKFFLWCRRNLARKAYYCIIPNEKRLLQFKAAVGNDAKAICVWNCPSKEEVSPQRKPKKGDPLHLLYHGTIVPPRLPLAVLEALHLLPEEIMLQIIGYETIGHIGYRKELQKMSSKLGIIHRVEFIETLPRRSELLEKCQTCDVGLALFPKTQEDLNHHAMIGASNKPFDYLACGLALLVSDIPDWRRMYVDQGYGLACDPENPLSIAKSLLWFLEHPTETREMGEVGRIRVLEDWNYETQSFTLMKSLNNI